MDDVGFDCARDLVWSRRHFSDRDGRTAVIYLSNKLRKTPDSGGARRDFELLTRLTKEFDVYYVAISPDHEEERDNLDKPLADCRSVTLIGASSAHAPPGVSERIANHNAPQARKVIAHLIETLRPAVIHVNGYFLVQHVPRHVEQPLILQEENIEFQLARDEAALASKPATDALPAPFGEKDEIAAWRRARHCIAVTEEDAASMRRVVAANRVHCLPNGLASSSTVLRPESQGSNSARALFVGNYRWAPSRDAAEYISSCLWPAVRKRAAGAEIDLAGAGAEEAFSEKLESSPGVRHLGPYAAFGDLVSVGTVFISPLRFGGGNKMKLVEALGAGLPSIVSSETLRGFPDQVRDCVSVCDTLEAFAHETARFLASEALRARASASAWKAARSLPPWGEVAGKVGSLWRAEAGRSEPA